MLYQAAGTSGINIRSRWPEQLMPLLSPEPSVFRDNSLVQLIVPEGLHHRPFAYRKSALCDPIVRFSKATVPTAGSKAKFKHQTKKGGA
ncbi:hypothetical protein DSW25_15840 [Sulfitobacter donghicola DSW-25 = KCTC 12864 = JCM 14565]|uniref:Uncharacterized protein n=2 Tax=Sulfitobacter TaxID=60136 RepID=A0A073IT76_9RHOB|nr:hypothetical protein DSW25_15840 [Sulfitobacter donghicola DSW-25 = KCTC 12864 = JCM 14565]